MRDFDYILRLANAFKTVTESLDGNKLKITIPLLKDLEQSVNRTIGGSNEALKIIEDSIANESLVYKKDILKLRDYAGNLALLCNMILNDREYSKEDKEKSISDDV